MWSNNDGMNPNWKPSDGDSFTQYMQAKKDEYLRTHPDHFNTVHVTNWAHEYVRKLEAENERLRVALEFYAKCEHMHDGGGYWEDVSGDEWCSVFITNAVDDLAHVENGNTARAALSGKGFRNDR